MPCSRVETAECNIRLLMFRSRPQHAHVLLEYTSLGHPTQIDEAAAQAHRDRRMPRIRHDLGIVDAFGAVVARSAARAADLKPTIDELRASGVTTLSGLAEALTAKGISTARGSSWWSAVQVQRVLARLRS